MNNKNYIKQNLVFFQKLNRYLILVLKIENGKEFSASWNATFEEAVNRSFPGSEFSRCVTNAYNVEKDYLQTTINIAESIDVFFNEKGTTANKYYKSLSFDQGIVKRIKVEKEILEHKSKGFISSLFRRK